MPEKTKLVKPTAKPTAKPAAKPTAKPATKPTAKPVAKPAAKPAPKAAAPAPTIKLSKGDTGGNKAIVTRKTRPDALMAKVDAKPVKSKVKGLPVLPGSDRAALVAREAYFMAERRDFSVGNDLADWLEAERIVDESYLFT